LRARLPPGTTTTTWFTILALFIPTPETKKPELRQLPDDQVSPAYAVTTAVRTANQLYSGE